MANDHSPTMQAISFPITFVGVGEVTIFISVPVSSARTMEQSNLSFPMFAAEAEQSNALPRRRLAAQVAKGHRPPTPRPYFLRSAEPIDR
jgi:hypothetical protein